MKDEDAVDRIIGQWRQERPDLDPSGKAVTGRVVRAADLISRRNEAAFAPLGIKGGEYSALSALRRSGAPYELSPSQMSEHLMVTSGGLSLMSTASSGRGWCGAAPIRRTGAACWSRSRMTGCERSTSP